MPTETRAQPEAHAASGVQGPDSRPNVVARRALAVATVVLGLVGGLSAAYVGLRPGPEPSVFGGPPSVASLDLPGAASPAPGQIGPEQLSERSAGPEAAPVVEPRSARDALDSFLGAEIARRPEESFALVDRGTQLRLGSVAAWERSRPNRLVPESFTVTGEQAEAGRVRFTVEARRTPGVTPFSGFVPGSSTEVWEVADDGGWRVVDGRPSEVDPDLPSDAAAQAVAQQWADRLAGCDRAGAGGLELSSLLIGTPGLADGPCAVGGTWRAAPARPLSEVPDATPFVAAFGPTVGRWGRAVTVATKSAPGFTAVLAPLGDQWRVMGVVPPGAP